MTNVETKENSYNFIVAEVLYYLYFAVMLGAKGIGLSGGKLYLISLAVGALLIVLKLLFTDMSIGEWLVFILLLMVSVAIYLKTDQFGAIIIVATVAGMKGVSSRRVLKLGCAIWVITFAACIVMALLGLRGDIFYGQSKLGLGFIIRRALGQPHPNVLQVSFMLLCAFILYLGHFHGKKLYIITIVMAAVGMYIFMYSISYTGLILTYLYLGMNLYLTEWRADSDGKPKSLNIVEKIIATAIIPVCALFSILGPLYMPGRAWDICNKILNTRFNIAKQYMLHNPVSLFGSGYCDELSSFLNNLDCSYVFALMHYGIIFFIVLFAAYEVYVVWMVFVADADDRMRCRTRSVLVIVLVLCIAAVSEPFFVNTSFKNISFIFLGEFLYEMSEAYINRHPDKLLCKKIQVLGRNFALAGQIAKKIDEEIDKLARVIRNNAKLIILISLVTAIVAGVIVGVTHHNPSGYYLIRDHVQIKSEGVLLDINNLPADFDAVILEYVDANTPMYMLDGNAVLLEYIRVIVSAFFWCGLGGALVTTIILRSRQRGINK